MIRKTNKTLEIRNVISSLLNRNRNVVIAYPKLSQESPSTIKETRIGFSRVNRKGEITSWDNRRLKGHKILTAFVYWRPFANISQTCQPLFLLCYLCSSPIGPSSPKGCDNPSKPSRQTTGTPFWIWTKHFPQVKIYLIFFPLPHNQVPCRRNSWWPALRPPAGIKSCPKQTDILPHCSSRLQLTQFCFCRWTSHTQPAETKRWTRSRMFVSLSSCRLTPVPVPKQRLSRELKVRVIRS